MSGGGRRPDSDRPTLHLCPVLEMCLAGQSAWLQRQLSRAGSRAECRSLYRKFARGMPAAENQDRRLGRSRQRAGCGSNAGRPVSGRHRCFSGVRDRFDRKDPHGMPLCRRYYDGKTSARARQAGSDGSGGTGDALKSRLPGNRKNRARTGWILVRSPHDRQQRAAPAASGRRRLGSRLEKSRSGTSWTDSRFD